VFDFKGFIGAVKRYPVPFALTLVVVVVFAGSTIVGLYNRVRASVPVLPAVRASVPVLPAAK
jgi:hypothetical protein